MEKRDRLEFDGEVVESNHGKFRVLLDNDNNEPMYVLCTLSGKIRMNSVKILLGDRVTVEVSEYDTNMGRIVFRHKN